MLQRVSLVWGALAFVLLIPGFWSVFIAINWVDLPFAAAGLVLSVVALIKCRHGNGPALAGLVASLNAVIIGILRLVIGSSPL